MVTFRLYFRYVCEPILYDMIVKVQITFLKFTESDAKAYTVPPNAI